MKRDNKSFHVLDLRKVARLARLSLTKEEEKKFTKQISEVISYFTKLQECDTSNIPPTFSVVRQINRFQKCGDLFVGLTQKQVFYNASKTHKGYICTKGIL